MDCGVSNECDPALALLSDYIKHKSTHLRLMASMGLGLAYAGSAREDVLEAVGLGICEETLSSDVVGIAALSSGLIAVGTGNGNLTESLVQVCCGNLGDVIITSLTWCACTARVAVYTWSRSLCTHAPDTIARERRD